MTLVGTYLRLYDREGGQFCLTADAEPSIDAAVEQYVSSGRTKDTLLHLTTTEGESCCMVASNVMSWMA